MKVCVSVSVCVSLSVCVSVCVCMRALMCMQDINLLSDMACRCFSTYLGCLFIFLRVFSAAQMFLLLQSLLSLFVDVACAFGVPPTELPSSPAHRSLCYVFS